MTDDTIYTDMVQPRGNAYRSDQLKPWSHYREPIDSEDGRLHGESRRWGDASPQTQSRVIDSLIDASHDAGLSARETAYVLAIARVESGFNPDAAAGTTSASGLGQFIDRTGAHYGINGTNRFDVQTQSQALVQHFVENRNLAHSRGQGEDYIYKYHHDGPTQNHGGLALSRREITPYLERYEQFVEQHRAQTQGHAPNQPAATAPPSESRTPRSDFQQTMERMLPGQGGTDPHITGHYGEHRGSRGAHGGTDFNYEGGQAGLNKQHPTVHAPIAGTVTFSGGQYGTVKILDAQGNSHEILHLDSRSVRQGQTVNAGDPIGTMGGRGPEGPNQYAQHVHYQIKGPNGATISPETWWNQGRQIEAGERGQHHAATGTLVHGDHNEGVRTLQQQLNQLGVRDAHGKPLTEDGRFGDNTRDAVRTYQQTHGLLVDGKAGTQTLGSLREQLRAPQEQAQAPQRQTPAEADPLVKAVRERMPEGTTPEVAANVALQAKQSGIDSADKLRSITVQDDKAYVLGTTPGFRAVVDLQQPAPPLEQTNARLLASHAAQQQNVQEEQQRIVQGGR